MGNAEDAEEVVQEAYLRALRDFSSFCGEASLPLASDHRAKYIIYVAA